MRKKEVIAILCSDLHLQLKAPVARSAEPDWFAAMRRPCKQLCQLQHRHGGVPVLCAGDVFDKWNSSAEVVNFALEELPDNFHAVPGQHDLPYHAYNDISKSAYWTLVLAGKINDLQSDHRHLIDGVVQLMLSPFPWGVPLESVNRSEFQKGCIHVALIHRYAWMKGHSYPGASTEENTTAYKEVLAGYHASVFGDNHKGFLCKKVLNCGGFMRRKIDEIDAQPCVGLLFEDGSMERSPLDCSKDKFIARHVAQKAEEKEIGMSAFIQELQALGEEGLDFTLAIERYMKEHRTTAQVRELILDSIGQ
jgi:hypothetical protein